MARTEFNLLAGIDVGNGYTKAVLQNMSTGLVDEADLPSAMVSTLRAAPKVPVPDSRAKEVVVDDDFFNAIDGVYSSPLVERADRKIIGHAALHIPGSLFSEFTVRGHGFKADTEMTKVIVLGLFAAKALRDYVRDAGRLPTRSLHVTARAGLALPISQYIANYRTYAAQFVGVQHVVTIKNFTSPVTVEIDFEDVQVIAEGASAQYSISEILGDAQRGNAFVDIVKRDLGRVASKLGGPASEVAAALDRDTLLAVSNTIGVDIGEGTVNFPVFTDGAFDGESSTTLDMGYGTALERTREALESASQPLTFPSRKHLADFLVAGPKPLTRSRWERVSHAAHDEAEYLVSRIDDMYRQVLEDVGAATEVVYVYGGGSGPLRELLYPRLVQRQPSIPVLYLDSSYSRHLNREGLYLAAKIAAKRDGRRVAKSAGEKKAAA